MTSSVDFESVSAKIKGSHPQMRKQRRSRYNFEGQTFDCRCGKKYLSIPSLQFHIKTKHSQWNKDTFQQQSSNQSLDVLQQKEKMEIREENQDTFFTKIDKEALQSVYELTELQKYLDKFLNESDLQQCQKDQKKTLFNQIAREIVGYWTTHQREEELLFDGIYQTPLTYVLGLFLIKVKYATHSKYHIFLEKMVVSLDIEINSFYQNFRYTKTNPAATLPVILNQILPKLSDEDLKKSRKQSEKMRNVTCVVLLFLCRWLERGRFTDLKLRLNMA